MYNSEWRWMMTGKDLEFLEWMNGGEISHDSNVLTDALRSDKTLVRRATERFGKYVNMTSMSRLATILQMMVFNLQEGPERDGKRKALRRHWYQWYKINFAIPFSQQYGHEQDIQHERWGKKWMNRLSTVYATFVDESEGDVSYHDLWIEDGSRLMKSFTIQQLFKDSNIIIAVEKDSLFQDFVDAARNLGAAVLISGKGKPSKAAAEKMLRDHFYFPDGRYNFETEEYEDVITEERPLIVMTISDHDYDGEQVINNAFASQFETYTPHVRRVRAGINPIDIYRNGYDVDEIKYQVKIKDSGYIKWAEEKAFFVTQCGFCLNEVVVQSSSMFAECPDCGMNVDNETHVTKKTECFGFEVEAMLVSDYKPLLVTALLNVLDFDFVIDRLRAETVGDPQEASERLARESLYQNDDFKEIVNELRRLNEIVRESLENATEEFLPTAEDHKGDFYDLGDDPTVKEFEDHVSSSMSYGAWRPFDVDDRTQALFEKMGELLEDEVSELKNRSFDWKIDDQD